MTPAPETNVDKQYRSMIVLASDSNKINDFEGFERKYHKYHEKSIKVLPVGMKTESNGSSCCGTYFGRQNAS